MEFIIDNYIWIIVGVVILVFALIGYMFDSNYKKKSNNNNTPKSESDESISSDDLEKYNTDDESNINNENELLNNYDSFVSEVKEDNEDISTNYDDNIKDNVQDDLNIVDSDLNLNEEALPDKSEDDLWKF